MEQTLFLFSPGYFKKNLHLLYAGIHDTPELLDCHIMNGWVKKGIYNRVFEFFR